MVFLSIVLLLQKPPYISYKGVNALMFVVLSYMIGNAVDEIRQVRFFFKVNRLI